MQVLEVLIAQIILDLRVQVKASKGVRQRRVVRHAFRARRWGSAGRRGRGRGRDCDEAIDGGRRVGRRGSICRHFGLKNHRWRALFGARRSQLVCWCLTDRYRVWLCWRLWRGDIKLERLEVALRAKTAHGGSMQKGEKISQKDSGSYVDSNGVGREIKGKGVSGKEQGKIRDGDVLILNLEYYVTTTRAHKLFSTNSSGTPDFSKWTISHVQSLLDLAHDRARRSHPKQGMLLPEKCAKTTCYRFSRQMPSLAFTSPSLRAASINTPS